MPDRIGTGYEVGECPPGKQGAAGTPGQDGETTPFHQFAEIVGGSNVVEHTSFGQVVVGITRFTEMADDVIRLPVDPHAGKEQDCSGDELRCGQPLDRIHIFGGEVEYPHTLYITSQQVEYDPHRHNTGGHLAFPLDKQWKDEGPLEIMQFKEQEKE